MTDIFVHPRINGFKLSHGGKTVEIAPFCFIVKNVTIARCELGCPPIHNSFLQFHVEATVIARDTDCKLELRFGKLIDNREIDVVGLERVVRTGLVEMLVHEVDECLKVNGKRVRDPHEIDEPPIPRQLKPQNQL